MMKKTFSITGILLMFWCSLVLYTPAFANIPGGGNGTGPNVTVTDNGDGTVTMANGVVSIVITKVDASIHQIYYIYNNSGSLTTNQVCAGGARGGMFYWEFGGFSSGAFTYSLVTNSGNYAEVDLFADSATNGTVDIRYSMFRGSPGFYVTPIWSHRAQDGPQGTGEMRDNIYLAPIFNWASVDAARDWEIGLGEGHTPAFYSPGENSLVTTGIRQGIYDDKYKGLADLISLRVWGWSSVSDAAAGVVGQNIGIWHIKASSEYDAGGPLNADLTDAPMVNMIGGTHSFPLDNTYGSGEIWSRASGPYFIYFNNVTNSLTNPVQTSRALFSDAQAQAVAEVSAWPYSWFSNPVYAPASQRGTITGKIVINDSGNPNASASNLWVGVVRQPVTVVNNYDFQQWAKPLHFWVKTDANGNFTIPNVVATNNYTLYAFGPGAAGTFMSQNQTGGGPPILYNVSATPFAVTVTGGATNNLGTVTWTPSRVGPTVFEIGFPNRKSDKFRHGDDYNVGDVGPSPTAPSPIWNKFIEYPFDFPNGVNYVVGQSRWSTDWNYVQSSQPNFAGNSVSTSSTITFNLASAPAANSTASLYIALAANDADAVILTVNGQNLASVSGVTASPSSLPTTGYGSPVGGDTSVREGNHGPATDERINFPGKTLVAGTNTIIITLRQAGGASFFNHFMYDYIRLELTGYVPPPPTGVAAYAGNNAVLLSWPVTPGATSYNILRSTTSGSGYVPITNGVTGPVCGSGPQNATYFDNGAANSTTYYYKVQSVNPTGASTNSPASGGVTPSSSLSSTAPATPTGLTVTSANNAVTLTWSASPGANYYNVQRGTVVNLLGYVPFYIILSNTTTNTTYTDASGTLGCTYSYFVTATSAGGTSGASAAVTAKPVPPPPAAPPANVSIKTTVTSTNQSAFVTWSPVSGAVGYILHRASNSPAGPFSFPTNYVLSMTTTNYTDGGLNSNTLFSYTVIAMNAGGVSGNSAIVSTPPAAPASLNAYPGNGQISLRWSPVIGSTNYVILRGTNSGNETFVVATTTNTTYTDTGLRNGTNYFYVVYAVSTGGNSIYSPEASAIPFSGPPPIYWINAITTSAQDWNVNSNWSNGTAFPNSTQVTAIVNSPIAAGQTINLNQSVTIGDLSLGASGGAFNLTGNGDALTFDDTPGQALLVELSASKGDTISAPAILNSDLNVSNLSASTLTLTGTISGTNGITILGPGTVALSGTNTFNGGLAAAGGTLMINNQYSAGNNSIQLTGGGTLNENTISFTNPIVNSGSNTWTISGSGNVSPAAPLTGSGQLNLNITCSGVCTPGGDWSQFAGTIAWAPGNGAQCRLYGTTGSSNAIWNLGNSTATLYNRNGGVTINLGALFGGPATTISGASSATYLTTYSIGALSQDSTFDGRIADGSGASALNKIGIGVLTLTGTNNTYSGGTTVNGGTLLINNIAGSGAGSGSLAVNAGGTLGGTGIISGPVSILSGGTLSPGSPTGTLTISNSLTLNVSSISSFGLGTNSDRVAVKGNLTLGGTLNVTNLDGFVAGTNTLFTYTGTLSGSLAFGNMPAGYKFILATNVAGLVNLIVAKPVIATARIVSTNFIFTGTGGLATSNYYVLASTNIAWPLSNWTRLATNTFDAAGFFKSTNIILPKNSQLFYQIQMP